MAIAPVQASNATVTATQSVRPSRETTPVQPSPEQRRTGETEQAEQAPPPRPTVNGRNEVVGTRINITA